MSRVQGIVCRGTGIVVERDCFDRDHGTSPPIAPDKTYWRFSDKERAAQPTPGGPPFLLRGHRLLSLCRGLILPRTRLDFPSEPFW
jgi:hypothetical protein